MIRIYHILTHGAAVKPSLASKPAQGEAPGHIKSLEEIEAEFASMPAPSAAQVAFQAPTQLSGPPPANAVVTLEELERQMMEDVPPSLAQHQAQQQAPSREVTPTQISGLAQSGYASQKAVLDSMFPDLGKGPGPVPPDQQQGQTGQSPVPIGPSPEELARQEHFKNVFEAKVQAMSKYNNLMGSSDKDFITRIQLSQLATSDPYISDFYAQVFSAMERSRRAHESGQMDRPTVVQIAAGFGFGVGGPAGNRFGKMGQNTMQKLSTQVKKLVESRTAHQKSANTGEFHRCNHDAQVLTEMYSCSSGRSRPSHTRWCCCSSSRSCHPYKHQARKPSCVPP